LTTNDNALVETAHKLAGSAGMFGFERVASLARSFERAVETGT
jgi:HPt (histidine-containing phosphotransfer) domain-containing protein